MTLLNLDNLDSIQNRIPQLEGIYRELTGMSAYDFCSRIVNARPLSNDERAVIKVASVPVTAGGGLIGNFAHIVAQIVQTFAGVEAFVTAGTDVTGFQEAVLAGADIVFMADDETCMAFNVHSGVQSDNSSATGRVFAALLAAVADSLEGQEALVLGMGKVGQAAFKYLENTGARAYWYDCNPPHNADLRQERFCPEWEKRQWSYIVECTTSCNVVRADSVSNDAVISAPGIPFGIAKGACDKAQAVIHDELESGILTMLCEVI